MKLIFVLFCLFSCYNISYSAWKITGSATFQQKVKALEADAIKLNPSLKHIKYIKGYYQDNYVSAWVGNGDLYTININEKQLTDGSLDDMDYKVWVYSKLCHEWYHIRWYYVLTSKQLAEQSEEIEFECQAKEAKEVIRAYYFFRGYYHP